MAVVPWVLGRVVMAAVTTVAAGALSFLFIRLLLPSAFGPPGPVLGQLWDWLEAFVMHFDLGRSGDFRQNFRPINDLLGEGLPVDAMLVGGALLVGVAGGLLGGVVCARRAGGPLDRVLSSSALIVLSAPVYWVGLVLILAFARGAGALAEVDVVRAGAYVAPGSDPAGWLAAMWLPWCITGAPLAAICLRLSRSALLDVQGEDYVRTARSKGLRERRVAFVHALPPALPGTVALTGAYAPLLVSNALLVEVVFNLPGVFRAFPRAINEGDFPLIQGLIVAGALIVALTNLVADLVLAWLDPRTRPWALRS
jgi:peptide/nickel transport system permease protein